MKKIYPVLLAAMLIMVACQRQSEAVGPADDALAQIAQALDDDKLLAHGPRLDSGILALEGNASVSVTDANEVVIVVDSEAFIFQFKGRPNIEAQNGSMEYVYGGTFFVFRMNGGPIQLFAVENARADNYVRDIQQLGYGIRMQRPYSVCWYQDTELIAAALELNGPSVFTYLDELQQNPEFKPDPDKIGSYIVPEGLFCTEGCLYGGPGSEDCSWEGRCSVVASSGYYACCGVSNGRIRCAACED